MISDMIYACETCVETIEPLFNTRWDFLVTIDIVRDAHKYYDLQPCEQCGSAGEHETIYAHYFMCEE